MHKLDLTISRLRLLLADVANKQEGLQAMRRQFLEQQARIVSFTVHDDGSVDRALSMMLEIDGRLDGVERSSRHLEAIRQKAQRDLDSLLLTKLVEETRARLVALRAHLDRYHAGPRPSVKVQIDAAGTLADEAWLVTEIRRCEAIIAEASGAAAKSLR
ncbi:MAG: hypothetical protein NVSMB65_20930 [Chloroflexota bacterium]